MYSTEGSLCAEVLLFKKRTEEKKNIYILALSNLDMFCPC